jgi:anti-anti-sigma factor
VLSNGHSFGWDGHLLLVHHTELERREGVAAWVGHGLGVGGKVIYYEAPDRRDSSLAETLAGRHEDALTRGQLQFLPVPAEVYSTRGQQEIVDEILAEGYPSVWLTAEAKVGRRATSADTHAEAERAMDQLCRVRPVSALCQYPADLDAGTFHRVSGLHTGGVVSTLLRTRPRPDGIALAGEVDCTNADVLATVLTARSSRSRSRRFVVDLHRLDFLDVGGTRALVDGTAGFRQRGGIVQLREAQPLVRRILGVLEVDRTPGVEVEDR